VKRYNDFGELIDSSSHIASQSTIETFESKTNLTSPISPTNNTNISNTTTQEKKLTIVKRETLKVHNRISLQPEKRSINDVSRVSISPVATAAPPPPPPPLPPMFNTNMSEKNELKISTTSSPEDAKAIDESAITKAAALLKKQQRISMTNSPKDARGLALDSIRGGSFNLKKVVTEKKEEKKFDGNDVAAILARRAAMALEKDSDSDSSDGDEWD
jgi:hypothetical protein